MLTDGLNSRFGRLRLPSRQGVAARLRAAGVHFLATLAVSGLAAGLVFGLWFPAPFAEMLGGFQLFALVVSCDLVLGPLISLIIYDVSKLRAELIRDYAVVGLIQLCALVYGLYAVAITRPAFVVFAVDRFEVVSAGVLEDKDLAEATVPEWRRIPWAGPHFVRAERPEDAQERSNLLFSGLAGKGLAQFPKYYRPVAGGETEILSRAHTVSRLVNAHPEVQDRLDRLLAQSGRTGEAVRWLPVQHPRGFWTVLIDAHTATPVGWLDLDPY